VYADAQYTQKMEVSEETMKTAIAAAIASENVNVEA
jgi:hypothetical protein